MNPEAPNLLALSVGINTVLWAENCFSLHSFWKAVATHTSYTVRSWRLRSQSPKSPCNIIWAGIMIHSNSLRLHSRESAPGSQSALPTFYMSAEKQNLAYKLIHYTVLNTSQNWFSSCTEPEERINKNIMWWNTVTVITVHIHQQSEQSV